MAQKSRSDLKLQIYRWLARREHSTAEIVRKSLEKGYQPDEIDPVIQQFQQYELLSDNRYARLYALNKAEVQQWGPLKIRNQLTQKGIKKQYIDAALLELYAEHNMRDLCFGACRRIRERLLRSQPGVKRKKKLVDYLVRRGFPVEDIMECADDLLNRLKHEEI